MTTKKEVFFSVIFYALQALVSGTTKICYNFKNEPRERSCANGCCGTDYEQYCCDNTLPIVGSVLGAAAVFAIILAAGYYCYRKKSKSRQAARQTAVIVRCGCASTNAANANNTQQRGPPRIPAPRGPPYRIPINRASPTSNTHYNPAFVLADHVPSAFQYDQMAVYPPLDPAAPMLPPYEMTLAPPPYAMHKSEPPSRPPSYNDSIHHMGSQKGLKPGEYTDTLPPPAN
ncbi:hypothetical protein DPMN_023270 [Dreissena polymorpha]|uniref:Uncharacterized protein n=1 Tax=Dreissena polymorpha TaxID=45954 RepID=A0A9D4RB84_DREPO|nr:hypothetical protein DPMN_023270 [Dreissena polymorpha]